MAKVFISFLGTGGGNPESSTPGYNAVSYHFDGSKTTETRFAQRSILEKHGIETFDAVCLLMTAQSKRKHRDLLVDELIGIGLDAPKQLIEDDSITTNQNTEQQWAWFDSLQKLINDGDQVIFDFTHGFRSVPIIFSTAISFLQKVKRFELLHAYYGYSDQATQYSEIIDMAKFYRINEWADGVARLVDMADASKLAELADEGQDDGFAALNDQKLTQALRDLTDLIKNIDVNNVGKKADEALTLIAAKQQQCSGADAQLLKMVHDKFIGLAIQGSGRYDHNYFQLQLVLTEMLLKHGLHMQAFTVMRECIASIGMLGATGKYAKKALNTNDGRRYRKNIGELFVGLCITARHEWRQENDEKRKTLPSQELQYFDGMMQPFFNDLERKGIALLLHDLASNMSAYRNGLDHAWTGDQAAPHDIAEKGHYFFDQLSSIMMLLNEHNMIA